MILHIISDVLGNYLYKDDYSMEYYIYFYQCVEMDLVNKYKSIKMYKMCFLSCFIFVMSNFPILFKSLFTFYMVLVI